jgi:hypothetical protein
MAKATMLAGGTAIAFAMRMLEETKGRTATTTVTVVSQLAKLVTPYQVSCRI